MSVFREIFETLRDYYAAQSPQAWWPDDAMEVIVGAVLVQGTTWKSVDRVLGVLKAQGLLDFQRLLEIDEADLAEWIRPAGFHTKKAKRLKDVSQLFLDRSGGDIERYFARDADAVRRELLTVSGIGPGTADNILLYAGKVPIYMVDPFTTRLLVRHRIVGPHAGEREIQELIHRELTPDEEPYGAKLFHDFQALVVRLGREFCAKTEPNCFECPLQRFLSGPLPDQHDQRPAGVKTRNNDPRNRSTLSTASVASAPIQTIEELELDDMERQIVERLGVDSVPIDSIIQATGLPIHLVRAKIAVLEMRRIVRQVEGNRVRRI